jgi:hypothetical protein
LKAPAVVRAFTCVWAVHPRSSTEARRRRQPRQGFTLASQSSWPSGEAGPRVVKIERIQRLVSPLVARSSSDLPASGRPDQSGPADFAPPTKSRAALVKAVADGSQSLSRLSRLHHRPLPGCLRPAGPDTLPWDAVPILLCPALQCAPSLFFARRPVTVPLLTPPVRDVTAGARRPTSLPCIRSAGARP